MNCLNRSMSSRSMSSRTMSSRTMSSRPVTHPLGRVLAALGLVVVLAVSGLAAESASPLADAMQANDVQRARVLVEQGMDVNAKQVDGMTPLHWAVYHDDVAMTKMLVAAGADVNATNRYDVPPLFLACENGNAAIVGNCLRRGRTRMPRCAVAKPS